MESSGLRILSEELRNRRIRTDRFSRDFYDECVVRAKQAATSAERQKSRQRDAFVRELQRIVAMLDLWQRDPNHPAFSSIAGEQRMYRSLFERHGL